MMIRLLAFIKRFKGSLLTGILIGTSYIPFPPWAILFCYIPLWLEVVRHDEPLKVSFFRGWLSQFLLSLIGFYWISYVSHEFGFMPWPVAILILILFAAGVHLYIPLAMALLQFLKKRFHLSPTLSFIIAALLISIGESLWPSLFPWNLGYTLSWIRSPIAQHADIIGFLGISLLILLFNAILAVIFYTKRRRAAVLIALFAITLLLHFTGQAKKQKWTHSENQLSVLQVQANIGNLEKIMAERGEGFQDEIANRYFHLTSEALKAGQKVDLIIWPESAYPEYLNQEFALNTYFLKLKNFITQIQTPLLTGAYSRTYDQQKIKHDYNALFLFDEKMSELGRYHKTNLLVFGEYTPLARSFPVLAKYSPAGVGFDRGEGPKVLPFRNWLIGSQICYESLYPEFSAKLAKLGADFIVNLTNDSWFGPTFEPYQHMVMTLSRAIEVRRPILRTTNTGFTTAALADGTFLQRSESFKPWTGVFSIPLRSQAPLTFYTKYGHWLVILEILVVIILLLLKYFQRRL